MTDTWDPRQYALFEAQRRQPFDDLVALVASTPQPVAADLGCGAGGLTVELADHLGAASVLGIDNSAAMLAEAAAHQHPRVHVELGDLATFERPASFDVIVANAALHWVGDHDGVLARWTRSLRSGGQLAVQVPANGNHLSHVIIAELLTTPAFGGYAVDPDPVMVNVQPPEHYAQLLYELGYEQQHVRLQVYGHVLADTAQIVEWTKGTTLTRLRRAFPAALYEQFLVAYRDALVERLGWHQPYFYAFKRILLWGRLPG